MIVRILFVAGLCLSPVEADAGLTKSASGGPDQITVTAPRLPGDTAVSNTQLSREAIDQELALDVADVLRNTPGLDMLQPAGPGGRTEVFLRGAESNFAIVTLDGVEMTDPTDSRGGAFNFSMLSPEEIDSVEILRGPLSAAYGSNALAGAINVSSRRPEPESDRHWLSAEGIDDDFLSLYGDSALLNTEQFGLLLGGAYLRANDLASSADSEMVRGRVATRWNGSDGLRADLIGHFGFLDACVFPDASGGERLAVIRERECSNASDRLVSGRYQWSPSGAWHAEALVSLLDRRQDIHSPGIAPVPGMPSSAIPASDSRSDFRRIEGTVVVSGELAGTMGLAMGLDIEDEDGRMMGALAFEDFSLPTNFDLKRKSTGAFAETRMTQGRADLFIGGRLDDIEGYDPILSGRLVVGIRVIPNIRVRVAYADGFRAPSFFALGDPVVGNPELDPEEGSSVEAGVEASFWNDTAETQVTFFRSRFSNLIDFDFATFSLINLSTTTIRGIEWQGSVKLTHGIEMGATYTHTNFDAPDGALLGRPGERGSVSMRWVATEKLSFFTEGSFTGERRSASVPTSEVMLDAFVKVDVGVGYQIWTKTSLDVSFDDVFDQAEEEAPGFPAPGRTVRVKIRFRM